jgi:spermidine/putrescine transport system permease protein
MGHVIIPFCKPAIYSGQFLTAPVPCDEFTVSWFVFGLNKTLPVIILEILQRNIDPQVNAVATFVFLIAKTLVVLAHIFFANRQMINSRP